MLLSRKIGNIKKIFYEKNAEFNIIPIMTINDISEFKQHISDIETDYQLQYHTECFFWKFDETMNNIIVNDNDYAVENDIFNQLIMLAHWLFRKNYYIEGAYHSWTNDVIEHVSMDGTNKFVCHHILVDTIPLDNEFDEKYLSDDTKSKIIIDAKNKIKQYIDSTNIKNLLTYQNSNIHNNCQFNKYVIDDKKMNLHKNFNSVRSEEDMLVLKSLQQRIVDLENNQKSQSNFNKFFIRVFTIIGLLTTGSFIYLSFNKKNTI